MWSLPMFFTLLHVDGINSQIIYFLNTNVITTLPLLLRMQINRNLGISEEDAAQPDQSTKICALCPKLKKCKTKVKCNEAICKEHTKTICKFLGEDTNGVRISEIIFRYYFLLFC